MKVFRVRTTFTDSGWTTISAKSKREALEKIEDGGGEFESDYSGENMYSYDDEVEEVK